MPNSKSYYQSVRILRILSIANFSFFPISFFIHAGGMACILLSLCANVSASVLLMAPDTYIDGRTPVRCGIAAVAMSAFLWIAMVVQSARGKNCFPLFLFPLAAMIPLSVCIMSRSASMLKDIEYLTMNVSGWEMLLSNNKMSFLILQGTVMSVLSSSFLASPAAGKIIGAVAAALSSGMYVILLLKSLTGGPVIGYTHEGKPYSEKDVDSCAYLREKSRMSELMYTRICHYVEENQPYLDPEYNLDSLARALISNKSYISKVINEGSGLNFCQLMNRYRVNFAKEMFLSNPQLKTKDLSVISGFNSQVTFNMAFKLFCDTTPGVWCKECRDDLRAKSRLSRTEARGQ